MGRSDEVLIGWKRLLRLGRCWVGAARSGSLSAPPPGGINIPPLEKAFSSLLPAALVEENFEIAAALAFLAVAENLEMI